MATRENQVATILRANAALVALLPGGIYSSEDLSTEGITNPTTTPGVYVAGRLVPCAVVSERVAVPTLQLTDLKNQLASQAATIEIYTYQRGGSNVIETANAHIYTLLQGTGLPGTYRMAWDFAVGPLDTPEMPGTTMMRIDFQIVSIRRPVTV